MSRPAAKRLRAKTPPPNGPQLPVVGVVWGAEGWGQELAGAKRSVYLVTFPHPKQALSECGRPLVAPESLSKQSVLEKFLDSCRNPIYTDPRNMIARPPVPVAKTGIWREAHKARDQDPPHLHDHAPVLAHRQFSFLPVKRALLQRHGLATHWSCTHDGYWSAIGYLVTASPRKPMAALDKVRGAGTLRPPRPGPGPARAGGVSCPPPLGPGPVGGGT